MDEPWGISGPAFLGGYGVLLVVATVTAVLLRRRARPRGTRRRDLRWTGAAEPAPRWATIGP